MRLEGSCHCGSVHFSVEAGMPYPYLLCYCSICRKTAGAGGGYAINLGGDSSSLEVEGGEHISVYHAVIDGEESPGRRSSCSRCASTLWVYDPRWPELIHPFASVIDTPLPEPPERVRIMLDYAASWAEIPADANERHFREFPDESLEEWHRRHGLYG